MSDTPPPHEKPSVINAQLVRESHRLWRTALAMVGILLTLIAIFAGGYATRMLTNDQRDQVAACRHALELSDDALRAVANGLIQHDNSQFAVWTDVHGVDWQSARRACRTDT